MRALLALPFRLLGDALHRLAAHIAGPLTYHPFVWPWKLRAARRIVEAAIPLDRDAFPGGPGSLWLGVRRLYVSHPEVGKDAMWRAIDERLMARRLALQTPDTGPAEASP